MAVAGAGRRSEREQAAPSIAKISANRRGREPELTLITYSEFRRGFNAATTRAREMVASRAPLCKLYALP